MKIIRQSDYHFDSELTALRNVLRSGNLLASGQSGVDIPGVVADIIADVAENGDQAVIRLEKKLDGADLTPARLRVSPRQIREAHAAADSFFLQLVRRVRENILQYQQHIRVSPPPPLVRDGRRLSVRYTPVERVCVYVPGGRALYPSTVLMTVVPAQAAGVREIVMVSPPNRDGEIDAMVLALAEELGVTEVYRLGGAVAVAAMALGTESIPSVRKIVGPGNAFVAEAKRQLFGKVGIDSIAGPSEVLIVADETAPVEWIAADMLAQAEHDPGSAVLVTTSMKLAEEVSGVVVRMAGQLERSEAILKALEKYSGIVLVDDMDTACEIASDFATEHLQIITSDDESVLDRISNAGAVFMGAHTPVPLGDYYAGPSHVLPTGGGAKFFGPLSVNDFLKASSVVQYDAGSLQSDGQDVIDFASLEGLSAHAEAVRIRLEGKEERDG